MHVSSWEGQPGMGRGKHAWSFHARSRVLCRPAMRYCLNDRTAGNWTTLEGGAFEKVCAQSQTEETKKRIYGRNVARTGTSVLPPCRVHQTCSSACPSTSHGMHKRPLALPSHISPPTNLDFQLQAPPHGGGEREEASLRVQDAETSCAEVRLTFLPHGPPCTGLSMTQISGYEGRPDAPCGVCVCVLMNE